MNVRIGRFPDRGWESNFRGEGGCVRDWKSHVEDGRFHARNLGSHGGDMAYFVKGTGHAIEQKVHRGIITSFYKKWQKQYRMSRRKHDISDFIWSGHGQQRRWVMANPIE